MDVGGFTVAPQVLMPYGRLYNGSLGGVRLDSASGLGDLTALLALLAIYFVGAEQGATSMFSGTQVHEFFHDARHLLGFPCH